MISEISIDILPDCDLQMWMIVEVVYSVTIALIDVLTYMCLFQPEISNKRIINMTATYGMCRFLALNLIPIPYYRVVYMATEIVIFKIGFNKSIEKTFIAVIINSIFIICLEVVCSKMCCIFVGINTHLEGIFNYKYIISFEISLAIARILTYIPLKTSKLHINLSDHIQNKNRISIICVSIVGLSVIFFINIELSYFMTEFQYRSFMLIIMLLMLYAYLVIRNIFRISVQELQAVKINSLEVYNKNLGTMYDNVRGFKHDFSNFVIALNGYVRDKNIDGIDKMSTSILKDCKDVNNLEILDPKSIGNPAIYSIITNKYNLAKENGIKVNLDILTDLKQSTEKSYAICRILGILLDNAIEAAKETDEKKMNVKFLDDNKFDRKLIIIENSYNNKDVNVDKIFEKGYTSKDDNSNSHGLGLWNIKSILENNEGLNLYTRKGDLFKQQLEIYTKF